MEIRKDGKIIGLPGDFYEDEDYLPEIEDYTCSKHGKTKALRLYYETGCVNWATCLECLKEIIDLEKWQFPKK